MAAIATILTACSKDSGGQNATNEKLNECLGISVPFPESAQLSNCTDMGEIGKNAQFMYSKTWKEATVFFSEQYSSNGWELTEEFVETREEKGSNSAPSARWTSVKNGNEIKVELHDYRVDESSGAITGIIAYLY